MTTLTVQGPKTMTLRLRKETLSAMHSGSFEAATDELSNSFCTDSAAGTTDFCCASQPSWSGCKNCTSEV